jgi:metallo-beta-lactamase family protein
MVAGAKSIRIHGQDIPVRAEVANLETLSAHADYAEILGWLKMFREPPRTTYLTHGEPHAADQLRQHIERMLRWKCSVPDYKDTVTVA